MRFSFFLTQNYVEMCKSIGISTGIGKYWLKFLVSVEINVSVSVQVSVSVEIKVSVSVLVSVSVEIYVLEHGK